MRKVNRLEIDEIDEISGVDNPAQPVARVAIFKRAGAVRKRLQATSEEAGHAHTLEDDGRAGGCTSYVISADSDYAHMHDWIRRADGSVEILAADGHSHSVVAKRAFSAAERAELAERGVALPDGSLPIEDVADLRAAVAAQPQEGRVEKAIAHIRRRALALGASELVPDSFGKQTAGNKTENMTNQPDPAAQLAETVRKLGESQAELAVAKALGEMSDAEKSLYSGMDAAGQEAFRKMTPAQRLEKVRAASESNPVILEIDGQQFRKNDDPRLVATAKRAHEATLALAAERSLRQSDELRKRAGSELGRLPGDETAKVALLRAVDGIGDETVRKAVFSILKAGNDALAKFQRELGTASGAGDQPDSADAAHEKLEALAKGLREKNPKLTEADAYALAADQNRDLYEQAVGTTIVGQEA